MQTKLGFGFLALRQAKSYFKQQGKGYEIIMGGERKAGSQDNIVFIKYNVYFVLPFWLVRAVRKNQKPP